MPTSIAPIVPEVYVRLLQQAIAATAPGGDVPFRHHGIGVLQAYLNDHERVHVWHPQLELPGMQESGGIHDHRFSMQSHVLVGELHHDEYRLVADERGPWRLYEVVHAKIAEREGYPEPTMERGKVRYTATVHPMTIGAGCAYTFEKRLFHRSWAEERGPVVTLVHKAAQEARPARLLCPHGASPVHAFGPRTGYDSLIADLLEAAHAKLREIATTVSG